MYICSETLIHNIHLWTNFFFWWKVVKYITRLVQFKICFFDDISSLKTGIYLTSLRQKTDKHFVIWVDIGYDFKSMQYQKTHYILKWSDKMNVCLWQISTWHYNDNVIHHAYSTFNIIIWLQNFYDHLVYCNYSKVPW